MESFLVYFLKSSGVIALFLLFYMLFLKRETFFRTNRIYLLLGLGLSLLLPFVVFTKTIWEEPMPMYQIQVSDEIMATTSIENTADWTSLVLYGYGAGVLFFTFRFVIQLFSLKKLIGNGKKIKDGKFIRVETDQKSSPFSFFNYLVFNPTLHTPAEMDTILIHEKVHGQGRHSADMLLMHLFTIFQWCNPFIWLYRGCLDDNLEYLTDTRTIAQNINTVDYQHLLLRTGMGENLYSVTTPFFNTSIKKRIIMLNKTRSHRKNSLKYALILPLLVGFTFLFNVKTEAQVKSIDSIQEDTDKYGPVVYDKERSGDFQDFKIEADPSNNDLIITKNIRPHFYVGDGKKISKTEFEQIEPDTIESIDVGKGAKAIKKYGDEGKDGVESEFLPLTPPRVPENMKDVMESEDQIKIREQEVFGKIQESQMEEQEDLPAPPAIAYRVDQKTPSNELKNIIYDYYNRSKAYRKAVGQHWNNGQGDKIVLKHQYKELLQVYQEFKKKATAEGVFAYPVPAFSSMPIRAKKVLSLQPNRP